MKQYKKLAVGCLSILMSTSIVNAAEMNTQFKSTMYENTASLMESKNAGPWFGDVSEDFTIYIPSGKENQTRARITGYTITAITPFVPSKIAQAVLGGTAAFLFTEVTDKGNPSITYYGTTQKRYREVYVGGEFAYFETMIILNIYSDRSHTKRVCSNTEIFEGQMMMSIDD